MERSDRTRGNTKESASRGRATSYVAHMRATSAIDTTAGLSVERTLARWRSMNDRAQRKTESDPRDCIAGEKMTVAENVGTTAKNAKSTTKRLPIKSRRTAAVNITEPHQSRRFKRMYPAAKPSKREVRA